MTEDEYRALPALNWSRLKSLRVSPLRYQHDLAHPREDSTAFRIGRAVHTIVLEGHATYHQRYAVYPGPVRRGKEWEAWRADHLGHEILNGAEAEKALACAAAMLEHPVARRHLTEGAAEQVITWTDPDYDVPCKGRVDLSLSHGRLVELKTAADIHPRRWPAQCHRYGYYGQLAYYYDGLVASGVVQDDSPEPIMVAVETQAPHDVVVWAVPRDVLEHGRGEYKRLLELYCECRDSGHWPGQCEAELTLSVPAYADLEAGGDQPLTIGGVPITV